MDLIQIRKENEKYFSEDYIKGFNTGACRQYLHDTEGKTGKWIEGEIVPDKESVPDWQQAQCSVCGKWHITPYLHSFHYYNYCPECGARMEAPHEK